MVHVSNDSPESFINSVWSVYGIVRDMKLDICVKFFSPWLSDAGIGIEIRRTRNLCSGSLEVSTEYCCLRLGTFPEYLEVIIGYIIAAWHLESGCTMYMW